MLLLLLVVPPSDAQIPTEIGKQALAIVVLCDDTTLEPAYAGQDEVTCILQDLSRDSVYAPGATSGQGAVQHQIHIYTRPKPESNATLGYQVIVTRPYSNLYGGDVVPFQVNVKATPQVNAQDYNFELVADYTAQGGYNQTIVIPFSAQVDTYDFALVSWADNQAKSAGLDDVVTYSILVQNTGVYPDSYRFTLTADPVLKVITPSNVYVPPMESRVVNFSVLTPHDKILEMGHTYPIGVKVNSMGFGGSGGTGVYSTTAILNLSGVYVPVYWIPLLLVGLVSMGVVVRGARETSERHRLERGAPREVDLAPRQVVLLSELKRTDPATYKEKKAALDSVYKERRQDYRAHRKERAAADAAEAKVARAEFLAQKKARREQEREAKKRRIEERRAEAKEAKLLRQKEKVLAKKRKVLEAAQAKQAKKDAKVAAKQAKIDAKAAAKQAKIDAKEAKLQAAADKKAAREAKKAAKQQK